MNARNLPWVAIAIGLAIAGCSQASTTSPSNSDPDSPDAVSAEPVAEPRPDTTEPDSETAPTSLLPSDTVMLQTVVDEAARLDWCDGFFQPEVAGAESQVYRLGDRALVELRCARAAYQLVYAYSVFQPDGTIQPLRLDVFYPNESGQFVRTRETTVGGLADFDPATGLLTLFSKARGIGDCGSLAEYRWTGRELSLETFRYQDCGDPTESVLAPIEYPLIYP